MTATLAHVAARAVALALWHARLVSLRVRLAAITVAQGRATGSPAAQRDDSACESVWKSEGRRATHSGLQVDITRRERRREAMERFALTEDPNDTNQIVRKR